MKTIKLIPIFLLTSAFTLQSTTGEKKNAEKSDSYQVNAPESVVNWRGEELSGKTHVGTLKLQSGSITMNGDKLEGGEFVVDMNTIEDNDIESPEWNHKLVNHLKSDDFFAVKQFPTASFKITSAELVEAKTAVEGQKEYNITGTMTIRGKDEEIKFPATIIQSGNFLSAVASLQFDRSRHNVKFRSGSFFENLGDKLIKDMIKIEVKIRARKN